MSSKTRSKVGKPRTTPPKRTPRTLIVDDSKKQLPTLIPESFNLKNFDFVGKIDDMRSLTKELSVMARQLEQWVGVAHTVMLAFRDNGVLKEVVKSLSSIGNNTGQDNNNPMMNPFNQGGNQQQSQQQNRQPMLPPFPFFGNQGNQENQSDQGQNYNQGQDFNQLPNFNQGNQQKGNNNQPGFNLFEIINNPAFQEIISKLFLQKK